MSAVLGSDEEVVVAGLGLVGLATVVLVTVVLVVVVVVGVAVAGFTVRFAVGPVVGSTAAGPASAEGLPARSRRKCWCKGGTLATV